MSQSVQQCLTVDLFPHILANVVDIQKEHLLLHRPVLNKTPRLSFVIMLVRLYRLLLIHCIYVSVTKPTCPAFSGWLNTGSIRPLKVTGINKAIMLCSMALPSKLCAALHGQSNVGSIVWLQAIQKFGLVSFGGNSIMVGQWPLYRSHKELRCQHKVNIMSNRKGMLTKDAPLSSHLAD